MAKSHLGKKKGEKCFYGVSVVRKRYFSNYLRGRMKGKWAVTGASGFVGKPLCDFLEASGERVDRLVRKAKSESEKGIGDIGPESQWASVLSGCAGIIHLAARVHLMQDPSVDPLFEYRKVNTAGTLELAKQAAEQGVRRFIFISSVKVNGESGFFSPFDSPAPSDPYSISKLEAEEGLKKISQKTGMELVVLRPPLIYGPGVRANFYKLIKAVDRGLPLPLGGIKNRRSLIFLRNLLDAIKTVMYQPQAAGKTYLLSDNEVVSTSDLIRLISKALGRKTKLLNISPKLIEVVARLVRRDKMAERLLSNLEIDSSYFKKEMNWVPPYTLVQGIAETVHWYQAENNYD